MPSGANATSRTLPATRVRVFGSARAKRYVPWSVTAAAKPAVRSTATNVEEVIAEIAVTRLTERGATRGDDKVSDAAMEDRKKEGYF